jgi:hypothetical protein
MEKVEGGTPGTFQASLGFAKGTMKHGRPDDVELCRNVASTPWGLSAYQ